VSPTAIETGLTAARREDSQRRGLWRNERACAFVVPREGGKTQKFRLRQLLAERLAGPRPDEESPWS
jgi:hypothetical protein